MNPVIFPNESTSAAAAAYQVATHGVELKKLEIMLNTSATAGLFLQVFDSATVPPNGARPQKSWLASQGAYKEFKNGELTLSKGLYVCLSSTGPTKTLAVGVSDLLDLLQVELVQAEQPSGLTVVGDLTTDVQTLDVWSEAAGAAMAKRLHRLEVDGGGVETVYLQIFAIEGANLQLDYEPVLEVKLTPVTVATTHRARNANVVTITTATPHNLRIGSRVTTRQLGGANYNVDALPVLSVPSPTTFTISSAGGNEGTTADAGGLVATTDYTVANGRAFEFGKFGRVIEQRLGGVLCKGCSIFLSTVSARDGDVTGTTAAYRIKAEYR